ncbi:MAG TPA: V-type ATP synthase subunit F [Firmicutes bacterium]|nr:V-type ATP synthase subunit F [Bacillota bacterium]
MLNKQLALVGEKATVVAFEGLGVAAFPVESPEEARKVVSRLIRKKEHAVIFVTEDIGKAIEDIIAESAREYEPSVVLVPSSAGSQKIGLRKLSQVLKRALGTDILKIE